MKTEFISIIQKLIAEQGRETLLAAAKCKAFLADYTRGEYKKESRLLLQAIEAGVAKAIEATDELDLCKQRQTRLLQEDYYLAPEMAADVVDMLAGVLRGDVTPPPVAAPGTVKNNTPQEKGGRQSLNETTNISGKLLFAFLAMGIAVTLVYFGVGCYVMLTVEWWEERRIQLGVVAITASIAGLVLFATTIAHIHKQKSASRKRLSFCLVINYVFSFACLIMSCIDIFIAAEYPGGEATIFMLYSVLSLIISITALIISIIVAVKIRKIKKSSKIIGVV
jgi:hypothetical protein